MNKTRTEIDATILRLLKSDKPKIIAADLDNEKELTDQQIIHFKTAEYMWNLHPHPKEDRYKGKFMGLLLDEELNYVHIVFASKRVLDYIFNK